LLALASFFALASCFLSDSFYFSASFFSSSLFSAFKALFDVLALVFSDLEASFALLRSA
jgi:hypothetical protein